MREGLFPELGRGVVDFSAVVEALKGSGYRGWVVVEQDVLLEAGPGARLPRNPKESARRNRDHLRRLGL